MLLNNLWQFDRSSSQNNETQSQVSDAHIYLFLTVWMQTKVHQWSNPKRKQSPLVSDRFYQWILSRRRARVIVEKASRFKRSFRTFTLHNGYNQPLSFQFTHRIRLMPRAGFNQSKHICNSKWGPNARSGLIRFIATEKYPNRFGTDVCRLIFGWFTMANNRREPWLTPYPNSSIVSILHVWKTPTCSLPFDRKTLYENWYLTHPFQRETVWFR